MPTTTIRLSDELKARVNAVAKRVGTTAHGFILDAIAEKTAQEERRADFDTVADERHANILATGKTIPWQDMRRYLEDRIDGKGRILLVVWTERDDRIRIISAWKANQSQRRRYEQQF